MSTKPTRTFMVFTGPIAIPSGEAEYELVVPPQEHIIRGKEVKGLQLADQGYFAILDGYGTVVWSCPSNQVLWCKVQEPAGELKSLAPLDDEPEVL